MRLLLLSDIHSNLEALEACLAAAPAHDRVVNLGDVVGYNASPNEVCERVRALGGVVVRGNHDRACAGLSDLSEFNLVAAMSARWTQTMLQPEHTDWLRDLPQGPLWEEDLPGLEFVHGSPRDEDEYLLTAPSALLDFGLCGHSNVIFFGHTHLQGGFVYKAGRTQYFTPSYSGGKGVIESQMTLVPGERYLINPGSVGQPRDNEWRAAFALYERDGDAPPTVTFYRVPYDVQQAQARVLAANLPERLAIRLALGR
ncbi:MAG TPA: metallophosphoesterase family protein [Terriglobales bacterium]|nr:metallophosphoesterase family protein [Terriglobales bacterium]